LPLCIRVLILVNTDKEPKDLVYKYLKGAEGLRS
jgi:chorismate mutase